MIGCHTLTIDVQAMFDDGLMGSRSSNRVGGHRGEGSVTDGGLTRPYNTNYRNYAAYVGLVWKHRCGVEPATGRDSFQQEHTAAAVWDARHPGKCHALG
jgi:hypothetical protein